MMSSGRAVGRVSLFWMAAGVWASLAVAQGQLPEGSPGFEESTLEATQEADSPESESPAEALDLLGQELEPAPPRGVTRKILVPWSLKVLGPGFTSYTNEDASTVLTTWLVNALIDMNVFKVANRDKIQNVLSEQLLGDSGSALSEARVQGADLFLEANLHTFEESQTSEIDLKVLDVNTGDYALRLPPVRIPYNPDIESMRPELTRLVAKLAAHFPVIAPIDEILDWRTVRLNAGTDYGIQARMEAELWRIGGREAQVTGRVRTASASQAEIEFLDPIEELNLTDFEVHVRIVQPAQAARERGRHLFEQGDFAGAVEAYAEGLEMTPSDPPLRSDYARALWRKGDRAAAVSAFRRAVQLSPNDVPLLQDAAVAWLESGRSKRVIEMLEQGDRWQRSGPLRISYGLAHEILGHYETARTAYRSALDQSPNSPAGHLRLGILAARRNLREEAERELRAAGSGWPEAEMATIALEVVTDRSEVARTALSTLAAEAEKAGDVAALSGASEVLLLSPDSWEQALSLAQAAVNLNGDYVRATLATARAYTVGGENGSAVALLATALSEHPENVSLLLLSGDLLMAEENLGQAKSLYERALDHARDDWRPADALGELSSLQEDHLQAVGMFRRALEAAETSESPDLTERLRKLGNAAVRAGQLDIARRPLERCVARAPQTTQCQYNLGVVYYNDPSLASASKAEAALRAAANVPDSAYYLGELYLKSPAPRDAIPFFRRCVNDEGCLFDTQSQAHLDRLESMTGKVIKVQKSAKNASRITLDLGEIHGLKIDMRGVVDVSSRKVCTIEIDELRHDTSVAVVSKCEPRVGEVARFGVARPKGVTAKPHPRRGFLMTWRASRESEVTGYEIYRRSGSSRWASTGRVSRSKTEFHIKLKDGESAAFRVVAITKTGKSLPSQEVRVP